MFDNCDVTADVWKESQSGTSIVRLICSQLQISFLTNKRFGSVRKPTVTSSSSLAVKNSLKILRKLTLGRLELKTYFSFEGFS